VPFFSVFGSQSHHSSLGIESMTDGTCAPQPNQVRLPIRIVSKEAGTVFDGGRRGGLKCKMRRVAGLGNPTAIITHGAFAHDCCLIRRIILKCWSQEN